MQPSAEQKRRATHDAPFLLGTHPWAVRASKPSQNNEHRSDDICAVLFDLCYSGFVSNEAQDATEKQVALFCREGALKKSEMLSRAALKQRQQVSAPFLYWRVAALALCFVFISSISLSFFFLSLTSSSTAQVKASTNIPYNCETPSLPRGSVHIVVGAYLHKKREGNTAFSDNNYLFEGIGLTNADIYWYRRLAPEVPLQPTLNGPCGVRLHERLLLPNQGRDGAALLDHILEIYDKPPLFLVFLHGHVALGRDTSCESVMVRPAYVYRAWTNHHQQDLLLLLLQHENKTKSTMMTLVRDHMMTLTSSEEGTRNFDYKEWEGKGSSDKNMTRFENRRLSSKTTPCSLFKEKWKNTLAPFLPRNTPFQSCCASFVLPGSRIQRYPKALYEDLQRVQTFQGYPDSSTSRECFEFIIYQLLGDRDGQFLDQDYQQMYNEADGLLHGRHSDGIIVNRVEQCKRATHLNSWQKGQRVRHRKWRNSLRKIGIRTKEQKEIEAKAERESAWTKTHGEN